MKVYDSDNENNGDNENDNDNITYLDDVKDVGVGYTREEYIL